MKTKGLETIVAAVLLIVIAVIGAALIHLWFSGFVSRSITQAEQITAVEKLKIEAAKLEASTGTAVIYIRNMTGAPVTFNTAYLLRPGTSIPICLETDTELNIVMSPGGAPGLIRVTVIFTDICLPMITEGAEYNIKLVTARGTEVVTTVVAT